MKMMFTAIAFALLCVGCGPIRAVVEPRVYVCESDGEIVAAKDMLVTRDGAGLHRRRIEDVEADGTPVLGCYLLWMRRSEICSIAVCEIVSPLPDEVLIDPHE